MSAFPDELTRLFDLSGRAALVTGASRGIGKAIARGLAQAGADVVIAARNEQDLASALPEILAGTGRLGTYVAADPEPPCRGGPPR